MHTTHKLLFCLLLVLSQIAAHDDILQQNVRQNSFLEWISSIFRPIRPVMPANETSTPTTPARECMSLMSCTCGTVNTIHRIVGGQETEVHQYPWMAMLLYNGRFYCGAALINDLYVTTAAHCVKGFNQARISVRLLEHNRQNSSAHIIERRAAAVLPHEAYSTRNYDNDIALIRLDAPVQMSELLRPVCLPQAKETFAGQTAIVTGWGALNESGSVSDTLQEVAVPVLSEDECKMSNYGAKRITANMLCAGYKEGGLDSCQGDSGGPLHVALNNQSMVYQLAGIVSWGEGCARPNSPGVYTRVNQYLPWIEQRTRDACACTQTAESSSSMVNQTVTVTQTTNTPETMTEAQIRSNNQTVTF